MNFGFWSSCSSSSSSSRTTCRAQPHALSEEGSCRKNRRGGDTRARLTGPLSAVSHYIEKVKVLPSLLSGSTLSRPGKATYIFRPGVGSHGSAQARSFCLCSVGACCENCCVFQLFEPPRLATALGGSSLVNGECFLLRGFSRAEPALLSFVPALFYRERVRLKVSRMAANGVS